MDETQLLFQLLTRNTSIDSYVSYKILYLVYFNSLTFSPLHLPGPAGKMRKRQVSLSKFSTNLACLQEIDHTHIQHTQS